MRQFSSKSNFPYHWYPSSNQKAVLVFYGGLGVNNPEYFNTEGFIQNFLSRGYSVLTLLASQSNKAALFTEEISLSFISEGVDLASQKGEKIFLAGHSFSAPLVLRALSQPERYLKKNLFKKERLKGGLLQAPFTSLNEVLETTRPPWFWKAAYSLAQYLPSSFPLPYYYHSPGKHIAFYEFPQSFMGASFFVKAGTAPFAADLNIHDYLGELGLPLLVILTQKDKIVPWISQKNFGERLKEKNEKTTLETILSGHNLFWDAPQQTSQIILNWLEDTLFEKNYEN